MAPKYTLTKVATAIGIVVPYLTLERFGTLSECFAASAVGALILRRYGFDAKAIPVDAIVAKRNGEHPTITSIIGSPNDVVERLERYHNIQLPPGTTPPSSLPDGAHVVIQCGAWIVDPTLGQINAKQPGLINVLGLAAQTKLDDQAGRIGEDTSVSWHPSAKSKDYKGQCQEAVRHYDPLRGRTEESFYADCNAAVGVLLKVNLDKAKWCDTCPPSFMSSLLPKLKAAGFELER
jgi:hypothetical protein